MKTKLKAYLLPIIILLVASMVVFLLLTLKPKTEAVIVTEQVWPVKAKKITLQTLSPSLLLYGHVESPRHSQLTAAVKTTVLETYVNEGDSVTEGDLLVQLDDAEARLLVEEQQAVVEELEAKLKTEKLRYEADKERLKHEKSLLKLAKKAMEREQELLKNQAGFQARLDETHRSYLQRALLVTQRDLDLADHENRLAQTKALIKKAKALLARNKIDVNDAHITAPFSGRITKLFVSKGEFVREGEPVIDLFDINAVELRIQIPERYVAMVKEIMAKGETLKASATVDGKPVLLELSRLAAAVEPGRGGIDGLFRVSEGASDLTIGKTVAVDFKLAAQKNVIAVPNGALFGNESVYKIEGGKLKKINITVIGPLSEEQNQTIITSTELKNDDLILVTHLPNVHAGLAVKVVAHD